LIKNIFDHLFNRNQPAKMDIKTAPLTEEQLKNVSSVTIHLDSPQLLIGCGHSVGMQRDHNEDSIYSFSSKQSSDGKNVLFGLFIVADGMGGHQHGEIASCAAVNAMAGYLIRKLYLPMFSAKPEAQSETLQEIMTTGVNEAQQAVIKQAPGGGTTMTAAFILGDQVTIAHVGDTRAYFIYPDGRMQAITRDHSLVRRLQEMGQITEKEAAVHPQRNVLYRAIGQAEPFEPDVSTYPFPHPGYLLMCSDGLWGVVPENDIFPIVSTSANPTIACQRLIEAANANGGPDNISVILIQYPS
jgi:serine/threonine protein phosphatase PrpC